MDSYDPPDAPFGFTGEDDEEDAELAAELLAGARALRPRFLVTTPCPACEGTGDAPEGAYVPTEMDGEHRVPVPGALPELDVCPHCLGDKRVERRLTPAAVARLLCADPEAREALTSALRVALAGEPAPVAVGATTAGPATGEGGGTTDAHGRE